MPQAKTPARSRRRHRRLGYRGYGSDSGRGSESYGGTIHWGRGFAGVGALGPSRPAALPRFGLLMPEVPETEPENEVGDPKTGAPRPSAKG